MTALNVLNQVSWSTASTITFPARALTRDKPGTQSVRRWEKQGKAGRCWALFSSASWTGEKSFPFLLGVCMDPIAGSCSACSPAPWRPPHTLPSLAFHISPCASRKQASLILLLYSNHDDPQWMTRLLLPENIPAAHAAISWLCPPATRVLGNECWWSRYLVLEKCKTILRFLRIISCRQPGQDPLAFKSFF